MNPEDRKKLVGCIGTMLLADHIGDAHEVGLVIAEMLWGGEGKQAYMESVDDGSANEFLRSKLAEVEPDIWADR